MKKYEELFVLIKSMSPGEKRAFKLHNSSYTEESNLIRLFNAVDKQDKYNESEVRGDFKGEKILNQLHVTKNHLTVQILKTLRSMPSNSSIAIDIRNRLSNIEILFSRTLYKHCENEINRAEKLCRKYEHDAALVEVLGWKRRLQQTYYPGNISLVQSSNDEETSVLSRMQNTLQHRQLMVEISKGGIDSFGGVNEDLILSADDAQSFQAKVQYYHSLYHVHIISGNSEQAEKAMQSLMEFMDSVPDPLSLDPGLYISSINNFVAFYVFQKKIDQARQLIRSAKEKYLEWNIQGKSLVLFRQILRTYNLELEIMRDTGPGDDNSEVIKEVENLLDNETAKIPDEYRSLFYFQLASIHFKGQQYSDALKWINQHLNSISSGIRPDLEIYIRLLNLMIHLELGNFFVLGYFIDGTKRYLRKSKTTEDWMRVVLKFFSKIRNKPISDHKNEYSRLSQQLFPEGADPILTNDVLDYIDFRKWLDNNTLRQKV